MKPHSLQIIHSKLLEWYFAYGRLDLPWRNLQGQVPNPPSHLANIKRSYGVYISEMMLQQTQVSVVLERFFFPFLETFPTLESIAQSSEEKILKAWQGLGYYLRARNIRKTALITQELFNGELPRSRIELETLPGIGKYSSGAIACFGFGENVSFVDGNITRVLSRLFALPSALNKTLEELAQTLLNPLDPFNHNQALIDLGATLCTPKNPQCLFCPLHAFCQGKDTPHRFPTPKKTTLTPLTLYLGFFKQNEKISLLKSSEKLYLGLYNPLNLKKEELESAQFLGSFSHHYTKYLIKANVYLLKTPPPKKLEFFSKEEIASLPISNLCKKALKFL